MGERSHFVAVILVACCIGSCNLVIESAHSADTLRCGNGLIQSADTFEMVRRKCGEPSEISRQTLLRRPTADWFGYRYYLSDEVIEIPVEIWTYNFGPRKLMSRLRFVGGQLEEIETLGYGYNESN